MMMYEFQLLPEQEQLDRLYSNGAYIGNRAERYSIILLYQYENFYVEVVYRRYHSYKKQLHCFDSMELLEPYLEQIKQVDIIRSR